MAELIGYSIPYLIVFLLGVFLTRWIFRIDSIVNQQREQTELLRTIAAKIGSKVDSNSDKLPVTQPLITDEELEREALSHPKVN